MSINPLKLQNKLCNTPKQSPKYSVKIKAQNNESYECGDPKITRALLALMNLGAVNGGAACHWGGPAAMAEMNSAIHGVMFKEDNWFDHYNFVNDIGHAENGIYALRANLGFGDLDFDALKGFRSIESKLTGHGESHLYPQGVLLSNGPLSSALPQAQGLAHADKLMGNNRTTLVTMSDGAAMEGEAKESFAAIPGLARAGKLNPFVLIISDNNTKLSGRISEDSFAMGESFSAMESLGWNVVKVENGNNLEASLNGLLTSIEESKKGRPVFLWLKTTKGYGVKTTEESKSGGHGFPLKAYSEDIHSFLNEIMDGETPEELSTWATSLTQIPEASSSSNTSVKMEKAQAGFARGATKALKDGYPVYSVSSDLQGSTGIAAFQKDNPDHYLDLGIAESNMVSHAAGLSRAGLIPIVDTFAAFGVTKGNLPLVMASLSSSPMIAVFSHTGFQDAADGASHQSLTYLSALSSIPNTKTVIVATSEEAEFYMYEAIKDISDKRSNGKTANSYIFFVGRENFPAQLESAKPSFGKATIVRQGKDGVLLSAGPLLFKAMEAADELAKDGIEVSVINNSFVNDVDTTTINSCLNGNGKLLTIEDHQLIGGLGAMASHALKLSGAEFKLKSLGVPGIFGQSAYKADELYSKYSLDTASIVKTFKEL